MEEIYRQHMQNELTEHFVYARLAAREKNPANRLLLERMSVQEKEHYELWRKLAPEVQVKPRQMVIFGFSLMRTFLGVTFTTKFLETHENHAVSQYQKLLADIPPENRVYLEQIIEEEKSHEKALLAQIKEKRVSYLSFIVLGLADAIVEITGVHAGFLGVTGSTLVAGVSGIIVGFAAAISMGSAAYLQAKQDPDRSAVVSAFSTGIAYIISVILLALPYFWMDRMIPAFIVSTVVGIFLIGGFTYYGAVVFDRKFWREFIEAAGLMLGTAVATFFVGKIVGSIFNIDSQNF